MVAIYPHSRNAFPTSQISAPAERDSLIKPGPLAALAMRHSLDSDCFCLSVLCEPGKLFVRLTPRPGHPLTIHSIVQFAA